MMELWPENQGQSPFYAKFGTVPGRNFTHNLHHRHQATHYPLYYGEQQDHGRESSYWTIPGSRTGGALQEYTTWTDPELCAPASSHFPFNLDRHNQQHQDLGEYQPNEARDREWTAAQQTARENDRGFLREGWQRRWDPCSPARYHKDVSSKRSDSSYRELEAWAARYSHSLPRRRRIEAELRGASHGLLESIRAPERDSRSGTDPRVAALQQVRQSADIRGSGVWERRDQMQTPTYYPPQASAPDTSHKTGYQRRMLSQLPGYIAPPPYNSPHKSSPVMHHCDASWEQEGKRQAYWSQTILRKQDVSVELQYKRDREKEDFTKPEENKTQLDGVKHRQETNDSQAGSPASIQNRPMQHESTLSLQQPQMLPTLQNTNANKQTPSKIIEGRKFSVNKKRGGMTIFCLVSRIAGVTETPSLPLCISPTNIQSIDLRRDYKGLQGSEDNQMSLADEVDFRAPKLTEQSDTSNVTNLETKEKETTTYVENEMPGENVSYKEETGNVSPEKTNLTDENSKSGRQSMQPVSVKYPLWREPGFTSRAETGSTSTSLEAYSEQGESEGPHNQEECDMVHPIDAEVQRVDVQEDTESEDSKGLMVIDTTCVVVKMELIPSPKKEHVHYLGGTADAEHSALNIQSTASPESNSQCMTTDENTEANTSQINNTPATDPCSDPVEKRAPENENEVYPPWIPTSSLSDTLEERAQRILGIPLDESVTEHAEEQGGEAEPSSITNDLHDAVSQKLEDTSDHLVVGQTEDSLCLKESDDAKDQVTNGDSQDLEGSQEEAFKISEENDIDSQLETKETKMLEDTRLESLSEDGKTEQSQGEYQPVKNDASSLHFNPAKDISNSCLLTDSDLTALSCTSESNKEEHFDSELAVLDTVENLALHPETSPTPYTPLEQLPSPLSPPSPESSPFSTPHHSPSPPASPALDLTEQTAEATLCSSDQDEISQITEYEISIEDFGKDTTEELVTGQQSGNDQQDDPDCTEKSNIIALQQTKEADPVDLFEPTEAAIENVLDDTVQLQLKCVKAEDDVCVKESYTTEEEIQKEVRSPEMTISQDSVIDSQSLTEANILQKPDDNDKEEDASCAKESNTTEEPLQISTNDDHAGPLEQLSQENTTDPQAPRQFLQDIEPQIEPSGLDCEVSQLPLDVLSPSLPSPPHISHTSDTEPDPLLEMDSEGPSACLETVLPPLYLDSGEESLHFSSYFPSESLPLLSYQKGGESIFLDLLDKEECQYPKSLWDAVNRIRKHTAPDSENEEEEVSEAWDPESLGEGLGVQDVAVDMNSGKIIFNEAGQRESLTVGSDEDVEMGQILQDPCHEELSHAEEDALSCSSTSTHSSGDTVIVAEEDEVEETTPDAETEDKMGTEEEFHMAESETSSGELTDKREGKEDEEERQDERETFEKCPSEACTFEVEHVTAEAVETMKPEQKESEDMLTPPEVAEVSDEVTAEGMSESKSVK